MIRVNFVCDGVEFARNMSETHFAIFREGMRFDLGTQPTDTVFQRAAGAPIATGIYGVRIIKRITLYSAISFTEENSRETGDLVAWADIKLV